MLNADALQVAYGKSRVINNNPDNLLIWLQLSGGVFPTGSFNHSYGLETYIQSNRVRNAADVEAILITYLEVYMEHDHEHSRSYIHK